MATPEIISEIYRHDLRILQSKATRGEVAAVLFFHGGGWHNGNSDKLLPYWPYILQHSVQCFGADYRVWLPHGASIYDSIEDSLNAARLIKSRIGDLPFFFAGASAGGALALLASIDVQAEGVICFNPVLDLSANGFVNRRTPKGGDLSISPLHLLETRRFPPILILQGEEDKTTPLATAEKFTAAARACGQPVELVRFPNSDHGFFNTGPRGREITAPHVWQFMQSHLAG